MTTDGDRDGDGRDDEIQAGPDALDPTGSVESAGGLGGPFLPAPPGSELPTPTGDPTVDGSPADPQHAEPPDQDGYDSADLPPESTGSGADGGLEAAARRHAERQSQPPQG